MNPRVSIEGYEYDMGAWLQEKSESLVESLSRMVDCFTRIEADIAEVDQELIRDCLHLSIVQGSRILAVASGAEWSHDRARSIANDGTRGFVDFLDDVGIVRNAPEFRFDKEARRAIWADFETY